ncbi:MAG TPA: hypothetical protein VK498_12395 [Ferruginibacter sp.]|nr:hypothetical protein [Ferruginibacter sp.]
MKLSLLMLALCITLKGCSQSNKESIKVGDGCEGCAAVYESPVSFDQLNYVDTLPDFFEAGPKMEISGVIYNMDGKPAKDVVLFIYHTDQKGLYSKKGDEKGWAKRQGYIRGWMKTNEKGEYKFYTLRPASYPNSNNPQHIHPTIKEPGKSEYWIDEFLFDDDPFLTAGQRKHNQQRGGDGVITLKKDNEMLIGKRNIYLGKNVPNYK